MSETSPFAIETGLAAASLVVQLTMDGVVSFEGEMRGIAARNRIAVLFRNEPKLRLLMGGHAHLSLSGPTLERPVQFPALVAREQRSGDDCLYELALSKTTLSSLRELLSCRRGMRIPPDAMARCTVAMRAAHGHEITARPLDLGEGGIAFLVRREDEERLLSLDVLDIRFTIEDEGEFCVQGRVVNRELDEEDVRYGVSFDGMSKEDQERLRKHILLRHRARLRGEV